MTPLNPSADMPYEQGHPLCEHTAISTSRKPGSDDMTRMPEQLVCGPSLTPHQSVTITCCIRGVPLHLRSRSGQTPGGQWAVAPHGVWAASAPSPLVTYFLSGHWGVPRVQGLSLEGLDQESGFPRSWAEALAGRRCGTNPRPGGGGSGSQGQVCRAQRPLAVRRARGFPREEPVFSRKRRAGAQGAGPG